MQRNQIFFLSAGISLLFLVGGLYFFVIRPRLAPITVPPLTVTEPSHAELPEEKYASLNLYFHAPLALSGIDRMEMTVTGIDVVGENGTTYSAFEGTQRITVQESVVQKVASESIYHGKISHLVLTFGPTARVFSDDRSMQTVFLPQRTLALEINQELPVSKTMNVLISLPQNTAFGEKSGVLTLELPASTSAETAILGGIFTNERSVGEIFSIPHATIRDAILADIGLDITPRAGQRGSEGFGAPSDGVPPEPSP